MDNFVDEDNEQPLRPIGSGGWGSEWTPLEEIKMDFDPKFFEYLWLKFKLLLGSRKFWVLLFACLGAYGLKLEPELQALVILVAGTVFAATQAYEDAHR